VNTTVISGSGSGGVSQVNTTIFIPPSIMGNSSPDLLWHCDLWPLQTCDPDLPPFLVLGSEAKMRPLIVMEGETVRMGCQATGSPRPMIKWTREDGYPIRVGASVSCKNLIFYPHFLFAFSASVLLIPLLRSRSPTLPFLPPCPATVFL